jgi:hypothetical protein
MKSPLLLLGLAAALCMPAPAADLHVANGPAAVDLSLAEIAAMPHVTVQAFDAHEKQTHSYSGVPMQAILEKVGVNFGEKLRGHALASIVVARAADGYAIVYALAEFDGAFRERPILLVDQQDGKPVVSGMGPLRLLCPGDARPARWIRMLKSVEVVPGADKLAQAAAP